MAGEIPDAVKLPGDAQEHALGPGSVTVEADVKAGSSYTLRFPGAEGRAVLSPSVPEASTVEVVIATATAESSLQIVADIAKDEFLHVGSFPQARFSSRAIRRAAEGYELYGDLDFHGVTRSIVVPLQFEADACAFRVDCEFSIDRRAFGAVSTSSLDGLVSDHVVIRVLLRVARKGAPARCADDD
jgi:polyisoprenoid-binding protein YceI